MTTQWSPTKINSNIVLSNGGLTPTALVSQGYQAGSCDALITVGVKKYWEIHLDALSGPGSTAVGLDNASNTYATGSYLGINFFGLGYYDDGTEIFANSTIATYGVPVLGDTICVACIGGQKAWFRIIHLGVVGNWNNDVILNQNPANGVGGQDISALGDVSPAYSVVGFGGPSQLTANFGASAFLGDVPVGYTGFDTVPVPVAPANSGGGAFRHIGRHSRDELEPEEEAVTVATTEELPTKPLSRKMRKRLAAVAKQSVNDDEEEEAMMLLLAA
jgi:hypothetical protein